jgi:hypothetical protein
MTELTMLQPRKMYVQRAIMAQGCVAGDALLLLLNHPSGTVPIGTFGSAALPPILTLRQLVFAIIFVSEKPFMYVKPKVSSACGVLLTSDGSSFASRSRGASFID